MNPRPFRAGELSKHRPRQHQIQEWFSELTSMKYGEVTSSGQKLTFTSCPQSPVSPVGSNQDKETGLSVPTKVSPVSPVSPVKQQNHEVSGDKWGHSGDTYVPTFKSIPDKSLISSGDTGDTKTPPSKSSETLMMSCTTGIEGTNNPEPTPKSKPKPVKNKTLELGDRVVVADPGLPIYLGQHGVVISVCYVRDGQECRVRFDKKVRNIEVGEFLASQLMLLR